MVMEKIMLQANLVLFYFLSWEESWEVVMEKMMLQANLVLFYFFS